MLNRTPLASALALAFVVPFASPALAQNAAATPSSAAAAASVASAASAASAESAADSAPAGQGTLPAIAVSEQAIKQDFQAERATVGAKTPTALRLSLIHI